MITQFFFDENVDIHHIFPQEWCKRMNIKPDVYDSIINKTPLSYLTNRIIGGSAPSDYINKLQKGNATSPAIAPERIDTYIKSHQIDPTFLRFDRFNDFMEDRQKRLLSLIVQATGKSDYTGDSQEEGENFEADQDTVEAELTITDDYNGNIDEKNYFQLNRTMSQASADKYYHDRS